jgi:hypothetical protein
MNGATNWYTTREKKTGKVSVYPRWIESDLMRRINEHRRTCFLLDCYRSRISTFFLLSLLISSSNSRLNANTFRLTHFPSLTLQSPAHTLPSLVLRAPLSRDSCFPKRTNQNGKKHARAHAHTKTKPKGVNSQEKKNQQGKLKEKKRRKKKRKEKGKYLLTERWQKRREGASDGDDRHRHFFVFGEIQVFSPSPPGRANKPRRSQIEISNGILNEVSVCIQVCTEVIKSKFALRSRKGFETAVKGVSRVEISNGILNEVPFCIQVRIEVMKSQFALHSRLAALPPPGGES